MMQQIAPLQTDIAAKSASDISSDVDKQWLGDNSQQEQRFGNGAEFGRALEQHKRENTGSSQESRDAREKSSNASLRDEANENTIATKEPIENNEKTSETSITENTETPVISGDAQSNTEAKHSDDKLLTKENLTEGVDSLQLAPQEHIDASAEINWVALVEEVKSLTSTGMDAAKTSKTTSDETSNTSNVVSIGENEPTSNVLEKAHLVDESLPIWDGEIADMIVIDENTITIKKAELKPIYTIELPPVQTDALLSGEAKQIAEVAESVLAELQASSIIQSQEVITSIEPDLQIAENNAVSNEAPTLLSALMIDLVVKTNDKLQNGEEAESKTQDNAVPENLAVADTISQQFISSAVSGSPSEIIIEKPIIKVDTSDANALKSIVKLDIEQQKLVFDDIASRVNKLSSEPLTANQQQNFVAALQAGVEEFSKQLQQGREPGFSIKALIAEAMGTAEIKPDVGVTQQLAQISSQLSQTLNVTDALRNSLNDYAINNVQNARAEQGTAEVASQVESNKQSQLSQMLDKPANILRPDGQNQFAEKIRWMVNARNSFAEIRLDPPDLGSVQVKVSTAGETATVSFVVQSQQARDALDQATPRLREMLAQQGIELGQSSVQQENQQQQDQQQDGQFANQKGDDGMEEVAAEVIEQRATGGVAGGIDFYA